MEYVKYLEAELKINEQRIKTAEFHELRDLLTQRAMIKDLLIEALKAELKAG